MTEQTKILASDVKPGMIMCTGTGIAYNIKTVEQQGDAVAIWCQYHFFPFLVLKSQYVQVYK